MRAVILNAPDGDVENMIVTDVPKPVAGPGEALVAVSYGGCNFADTVCAAVSIPIPRAIRWSQALRYPDILRLSDPALQHLQLATGLPDFAKKPEVLLNFVRSASSGYCVCQTRSASR